MPPLFADDVKVVDLPGNIPELKELVAQRNRFRVTLELIAAEQCTCEGYYRCNGCETRIALMAQDALDAEEAKP